MVNDLLQELVPLRGALLDQALDFYVQLRVQHREGKVLQLPLDRLDAEAVGQRSVNLQRLLRLASSGFRVDEPPGTRVVQAVGEFYHQHPDVFRHCDDHLSHGFRLRAVAVLELVELCDSVDEHRDLVAEILPQLVQGVRGVFHGVVEQRRCDRARADAELREDQCHSHGVGDVRLATHPELSGVRMLCCRVCPLDHAEVGLRVVRAHSLDERVDRADWLGLGEDSRQQGAQRRR